MEHIARTSGGDLNYERTPQNYDPADEPMPDSKKKDIQDHLERSKGKTDLTAAVSEEQRKRKVREHLDATKG
ncbi:MAG: hypothetical protein ACFB4I_00015 [Cyanophyceae cyanobacterium]